MIIPDGFLTAETMLSTLQNILEGLHLIKKKVTANVTKELPFLILEPVLIQRSLQGFSRQVKLLVMNESVFQQGLESVIILKKPNQKNVNQ